MNYPEGKDPLGFMFRAEHLRDGEVLWAMDWTLNQVVNQGYEDIFSAYYKGSPTVPADNEIKLGLYTNASLSKDSDLTDVTEPSGNGYARISVARADFTVSESGGQEQIAAAQKTFTASGGAWSTVNGAFLAVDRAAGSDVLLAFDPFATARTLQDGDQLKVTFTVQRQNPS